MRGRPITEIIGWDDRRMMLIMIPLLAALIPFLFFGIRLWPSPTEYGIHALVSLIYTTMYWLSMRQVICYFRLRFPEHNQTKRRLLFTGLAMLFIYLFVETVCYQGIDALTGERSVNIPEQGKFVVPLMLILLVSTTYEGKFFFYRWRQAMIETERLRRENTIAQLESLRSQVNPHFLFNSLNTLVYLIPEDPNRAIRFVEQLSRVYRYVLEIREEELVPLYKELEFLDACLHLVKERFGDNLQIELSILPEAQHRQLPPLSLQMLLENAIKHNIISQESPLKLEVFTPSVKGIEIRNNLQRKTSPRHSTGLGLSNIRHRFAFFTTEVPQIIETEDYFSVYLPLLQEVPETVQ